MANGEPTKKVSVELLCLSLLQEKDMYGYEMSQEIFRRSGGLLTMAEAAIYMSMYRLVKRGVVTDRRELSGDVKSRVRVYYHLTESGMEYFQEILADYKRSAQGMQNFFAYHTEDDHERN